MLFMFAIISILCDIQSSQLAAILQQNVVIASYKNCLPRTMQYSFCCAYLVHNQAADTLAYSDHYNCVTPIVSSSSLQYIAHLCE